MKLMMEVFVNYSTKVHVYCRAWAKYLIARIFLLFFFLNNFLRIGMSLRGSTYYIITYWLLDSYLHAWFWFDFFCYKYKQESFKGIFVSFVRHIQKWLLSEGREWQTVLKTHLVWRRANNFESTWNVLAFYPLYMRGYGKCRGLTPLEGKKALISHDVKIFSYA